MKAKNLPKNAFNTQSNVLVVICSFIILILFNGCSIAGLVIGSKIKSKKSKELQVPGYDFSKITHNKQITVMLNNSDSILGNYKDNEITKLEEYKEVYDAKIAKLDLDFKLPRIGDTLYLNIIHGYNFNQDKGLTYPFIFEGFDHQINWQKGSDGKMKVPEIMKRPLNANFQIEKDGSGYKVTVQDIWFSTDQSGRRQKNNVLENIFIQNNGLSFKKDKNTIRMIYYLSGQFSELFMLKGNQLENRF